MLVCGCGCGCVCVCGWVGGWGCGEDGSGWVSIHLQLCPVSLVSLPQEVQEYTSHDDHVTPQVSGEPPVATDDLHTGNYDNRYQEQPQDQGRAESYIPQSSLPATQPAVAPPPPANPQPLIE